MISQKTPQEFWFREKSDSDHWKVFGFNYFLFGDQLAAALMTIQWKEQ